MSFSNRWSRYKKRGIKDAYGKRGSPLLADVINILILALIFILILNCANIMKNYNDINDYRRKLSAQEREENLRAVEAGNFNSTHENEKKDPDEIPSIMPCQGTITSNFGGRKLSISRGRSEFHSGLDISNSSGTEIRASADGVVEFSGSQGTYGNVVFIKHNETYTTVYAHNSKLLVHKGDVVKKGQVISLMGSTGRSTGPHCHFEIRVNNTPVNPLDIIKAK